MAQHQIVALGNTASRISPLGVHGGIDITLQNVNDAGYIYIGSSNNVTTTDYGFRIMPNHSISFELPSIDAIYAISSSPMNLAVMITGLESQN